MRFIMMIICKDIVVAVQSLSPVWLFEAPWTAACQVSLSFTVSRSLVKLMSIESAMPSNYLICCPLLLFPSIFPSIRAFSNELTLHIRCQSMGVSVSAAVLPVDIQDWFPLGLTGLSILADQGTLKSLLHNHSSKASVLRCSVFFMVQLSHPYITTGKTIALTRWTFVAKVTSLLFNTLCLS